MAATFRKTRLRHLGNVLITPLARLGLAGKRTHILTVPGRRSGRRYSTPVQLVIQDDERWLVAPYGEREWVKNARAAGEVELTRAGKTTRYAIEEIGPDKAAPGAPRVPADNAGREVLLRRHGRCAARGVHR